MNSAQLSSAPICNVVDQAPSSAAFSPQDWRRISSKMSAYGRPFVKMNGLGNHFVVIDARVALFRPSAEVIRRICDETRSVGAEQLIVIEPSDHGTAFVRIYSPDGSEVDACGNAVRCVAQLLLGENPGDSEIRLQTGYDMLLARRGRGLETISVTMGQVLTDWRDIPLGESCDTLHMPVGSGPLRDGVAGSIGNPHITFFAAGIDDTALIQHGNSIQADPLFPRQINVGLAEMVGKQRLRLVVYERPGMLTMACGSGACAAVSAAARRDLLDDQRSVEVQMPGGLMIIDRDGSGNFVMDGPAEVGFIGVLDDRL